MGVSLVPGDHKRVVLETNSVAKNKWLWGCIPIHMNTLKCSFAGSESGQLSDKH